MKFKFKCPENTGRDTCHRCPEEKTCSYRKAKEWMITQPKPLNQQEFENRECSSFRRVWHGDMPYIYVNDIHKKIVK